MVRSFDPESEATWVYGGALTGIRYEGGSIRAWLANYIIVEEVEQIVEKKAAADGFRFRASWDDTGTETWLVPITSAPALEGDVVHPG